MSEASETRIPCSESTRELLKDAKEGGETYDLLLRRMLKQYDPGALYAGVDAAETAE